MKLSKTINTDALICLLLWVCSSFQLHAQCDGITFTNNTALIPNGNFEERDCCPATFTFPGQETACVLSHVRASYATLDYHVVDCGGSLDQPCMPCVPDGTASQNGMIGMGIGESWTEYLGTCLNGSLVPGITYGLKFKIGFGTPKEPCASGNILEASSPMNFSLFATNDCSDLPFAGTNCLPSSWYLGTTSVSGQNEWVEGTIEFEVNTIKNTIVFGPDCADSDSLYSYFYLDDMAIVEITNVEVSPTLEVNGEPCTGVTLIADYQPTLSYQWFFNGVPIPGATSPTYDVPLGQEGNYFVRMYIDNQCAESDPFVYTIPLLQSNIQQEICYGESFAIAGEVFDQSGQYQIILTDDFGCDSILLIDLLIRDQLIITNQGPEVIPCTGDQIDITLTSNAQGPTYIWDDGTSSASRTLDAGRYEVFVQDDLGCQSDPYIFSLIDPEPLLHQVTTTDESCAGYADGMAKLEITGGVPPYQYQWLGNDWQSAVAPLHLSNLLPADYSIAIRDANQCTQLIDFSIQAQEAVEVFIEVSDLRADGNSAYLSVRSEPNIAFENYSWTGPQLSCDDCASPLLQPLPPVFSLYHVLLTDPISGCQYEALLEVKLKDGIYIPNAFSPNGDGANDYFFLQAHPGCVAEIKSLNLYDRWGELLFSQTTSIIPTRKTKDGMVILKGNLCLLAYTFTPQMCN